MGVGAAANNIGRSHHRQRRLHLPRLQSRHGCATVNRTRHLEVGMQVKVEMEMEMEAEVRSIRRGHAFCVGCILPAPSSWCFTQQLQWFEQEKQKEQKGEEEAADRLCHSW